MKELKQGPNADVMISYSFLFILFYLTHYCFDTSKSHFKIDPINHHIMAHHGPGPAAIIYDIRNALDHVLCLLLHTNMPETMPLATNTSIACI